MYGKPASATGIATADQLAQLCYVTLRRDVLALVLTLGVDDQAIGAVVHGLGADLRLAAAGWLPYTYCQAHTRRSIGVQRRDQAAD